MLIIPALKKLRLEDCCKFKASQGHKVSARLAWDYRVRPCLNTFHYRVADMTDVIKYKY